MVMRVPRWARSFRFGLDERVRDRIVAETRGNPLALLELPRGRLPVASRTNRCTVGFGGTV
jgi:hypothetical protein